MTIPIGLTCPRTTDPTAPFCDLCGASVSTPCLIDADAPSPFAGPAIGAVSGTCDPDDGVCEACQ